jgi:hypothetical protein
VQSGARIATEAKITAALKACAQKKENRIMMMGSREYSDLTLPRMAQALPYAASTLREKGLASGSNGGSNSAQAK